MKTCVIIGGGIGGLVSGALLAKEGYKVTVLEKNTIIGGGLQTFKRKGVSFPTGMHIFGGFQEGGNLRKLFDYLGVMDKLSLRPTDDDASDVVTIMDDGLTYKLPRGKEQFIAYLSSMFPTEKEQIKAYIDRLFVISEEEDLFYLRESNGEVPQFSEDFVRPFDELLGRYITDPKLKALLGYLCPLFGGEEGTTPSYLNALPNVLHRGGTFQFVGGSQQLADALANRQVLGVFTKSGKCYQADSYISDVHPNVLLRIIDEGAFPTAFKNRVSEIPETVSSFKVFIKFNTTFNFFC